jgi:hypothetical protein
MCPPLSTNILEDSPRIEELIKSLAETNGNEFTEVSYWILLGKI